MKIIKGFLKSGILEDEAFQETPIGSLQGVVISPLLMNIYMDRPDKKMMERGIRMVRYADDSEPRRRTYAIQKMMEGPLEPRCTGGGFKPP